MMENNIFNRVYPSEAPDSLEITIDKYMTQDLLSTMLIYELLKTERCAELFINWLVQCNRHIEFEEALTYIVDLKIKETNFTYDESKLNHNLFETVKAFDLKHYLNDIQIAYLISITKENKLEEEALETITNDMDCNSKYFGSDDLRELVFQLIMPDDGNVEN